MRNGKITIRHGRRHLEEDLREVFEYHGLQIVELEFKPSSRTYVWPEPKKPLSQTLGKWTIVAEEEDK